MPLYGCDASEIKSKELFQLFTDEIEMFLPQRGLDAEPEGLVHRAVGVGQLADDAVLDVLEVGLACQIAGEKQAGADLVLVKELEQIDPLDPTRFLERDRETEPRGIAVGGGLGNFKEIAQAGEPVAQQREVALAGGDETGRALQLGQATGCLLYTSPSPRDKRQSRMPSSA